MSNKYQGVKIFNELQHKEREGIQRKKDSTISQISRNEQIQNGS